MRKVFASLHANPGKAKCTGVKTKLSKGKLYFTASFTSSGGEDEYNTGICVKAVPNRDGALKVKDVNTDKVVRLDTPTERAKFKVRCTCRDYEFTYASVNDENGVHYGRLPVFEQSSSKGTGKPRNPDRLVGGCKHIIALYKACLKKNYIITK